MDGLIKIMDIEPQVRAFRVTCPLFRILTIQPPPTLVQRVLNRVGRMLSIFAAPLQHRGPLWHLQPPKRVLKESTLLRIGLRRFDILEHDSGLIAKHAREIRKIEDERMSRELTVKKAAAGLDTLAEF